MHNKLGCKTISRSDFRYNPDDGVVFLEINTHPGMTELSLVPEQAKHIGISYEDLCQNLVEEASCRPLK
jgi:D-alanine-D-alanine ligase